MEFQSNGFDMACIKAQPVDRNICVIPPLFPEANPATRWKLIAPLSGIAATRTLL